MARIAGVDLPREKRVEIGLTYIYGIGRKTATEILEKTGIDPSTRVKDLSEEEVGKIRKVIDEEYMVEGDLRRDTSLNIKRLMEIGSFYPEDEYDLAGYTTGVVDKLSKYITFSL